MGTILELAGRTVGRLTVLSRAPNRGRQVMWHCRCECGGASIAYGSMLRAGTANHCGCLTGARIAAKNTKHGHASRNGSLSPEYKAWAAMVRRCTNPKQKNFPYYGGRGITVCDRWRESFAAFLADVGPQPADGGPWSLDRYPDVDGNYAPGNVRWATRLSQANNKRNSKLVTHAGETLTVAQWARKTGLSVGTLTRRLKSGWTAEAALTEKPVRGRNQFSFI